MPYVEASCRQGVGGRQRYLCRLAHRYLERTTVGAPTANCVLTHDAKFAIPLLRRALTLPVDYVGAMGSRRTHEERLRLLRRAGVKAQPLAALRSPIGLDMGGLTPEKTAASITAEIKPTARDEWTAAVLAPAPSTMPLPGYCHPQAP